MLSERQIRCVNWLMLGYDEKETGFRVGVHPDSITRWKRDPEFQEAMQQNGVNKIAASVEIARDNLTAAVMTLVDALDATKSMTGPDWRNRIDAAKALLQTHGMLKERVESSEEKTLRIIIEDDREAPRVIEGQVTVLELPTGDNDAS